MVGVLSNFDKFGINDLDRLGFGGDVRVLGLEIGDEGLNVCDCVFDFGVDRMIVFNVLIDLLKDLDFLSVGECVVVFARHGKSLMGVVLIPDLLNGIGSEFSVSARPWWWFECGCGCGWVVEDHLSRNQRRV